MTPKHKKPEGYAGSTPRGPARWLRAADNAMRRPNSQAARLFQTRSMNAYLVRDAYPNTKGPHAHWTWGRRHGAYVGKHHVQYYTCSLYCTAMVVQLDHQLPELYDLINFLMEDERCVPAKPKRTVSCQFCGSRIRP